MALVFNSSCYGQEVQNITLHSESRRPQNSQKSEENNKFLFENPNYIPQAHYRAPQVAGTELIGNGGFESGPSADNFGFAGVGSPWLWTASGPGATTEPRMFSTSAHSGNWFIYFDPTWTTGTTIDNLYQKVTIPAQSVVTLSFWLRIRPNTIVSSSQSDVLGVNFCDMNGNAIQSFVKNYHLSDGNSSYIYYTYDVSSFAGQTVYLLFWTKEVAGTIFYLDDVSLVSTGNFSSACVENVNTMCLVNGRYKVTSHWLNQYATPPEAKNLSKTKLTDTVGAFWIADANTYENFVRLQPGQNNGKTWVSISTFTSVEFWVSVTDTVTGQTKEYHSPAGKDAFNTVNIWDPYFFVTP